jgi:uncharacterized protein (DUF2345 family)
VSRNNRNSFRSGRQNPVEKDAQATNPVLGIYMAEVVSTKDVSRTGRLQVFIAALSKEKLTASGYFDAVWTSPFAGSTNPTKVRTDIPDPEHTISSYGIWAVPPDIGNLVLVAFGDGNTKYPMVISCLYPDKFNYMVPGNPGGKNYQAPNKLLPTMEKNKRAADIKHNDTFRPVQHSLAEGIVKQGLVDDLVRGPSSSGARRESPSEVFGLLTPGPRDPNNYDYRLGGHSITLDDNLNSRNIRIRTAQGQQILMDDTTGIIYFINKEGKVWMEFSPAGEMTLFAETDVNIRAKGNFNLRADKNVNIEAGQNLNLKACGDNKNDVYLGAQTPGTRPAGIGGHVHIESAADMKLFSSMDYYMTSVGGSAQMSVPKQMNLFSQGDMNLKTLAALNKQSGKQTSTTSGGDIVEQTSGNKVEKAKMILMNSGGASATVPVTASKTVKIPTNVQKDQGTIRPGYTVTKVEGDLLPTDGKRTGQFASVSTIVRPMPTAEPYAGHGVPNPVNENNIVPEEKLADNLPPNSTGLENTDGQLEPAGVNSPAGYQPGLGYNQAGEPQYGPVSGLTSNFAPAQSKNFFSMIAASNITNALIAGIPNIKSPVSGLLGGSFLGVLGKIGEYEASIGSIGVDLSGALADLRAGELSRFYGTLMDIKRRVTSFDDLVAALKTTGIITLTDGLSNIFVDSQGRQIIDFSKGLGSIGTQLLTRANLGTTANIIRTFIGVPISDHQFAALVSLANHIGTDKFAKSRVLTELNNGNYDIVPSLFLDYSANIPDGSTDAYVDPAILQRRQYEAELFVTPDSVPIPEYSGERVNFVDQAIDIRESRKAECINSR